VRSLRITGPMRHAATSSVSALLMSAVWQPRVQALMHLSTVNIRCLVAHGRWYQAAASVHP
jgi:hypothetical protein